MSGEPANSQMPFWQHLDELRYVLLRIIAAIAICAVVAFILKDQVFTLLLAPQDCSFITYQWIEHFSPAQVAESFSVQLINTTLSAQFLIHIKTSVYLGLLVSLPYILYQIFRFLAPALYANERRYGLWATISGYAMFMTGVAVCYLIIFPMTFRFLGTYQVSDSVTNMISLQSYIDTFITMNMLMGIVFELPVACWLIAKTSLLKASHMRRFRRHAIVAILILAAIITPTSDAFTMAVVSLPIYILYELSIIIVAISQRRT